MIKLDKPLVVIGLMGAGKTRIGRMLAAELELDFVDSDDVIVARAGMPIPEIFKTQGEAGFRALERDVIGELLGGPVKVISVGGGAVMTPQTAGLVWNQALSLWLRGDLEVLRARLENEADGRPMLAGASLEQRLKELIDLRYPVYSKADIIVETKDVPAEENLKSVVKALAGRLS